MATFIKALVYTLRHEGGWSNDPDDPGGATNCGITLETAKKHGILTEAALKGITQAQITAIYKSDYWRFDGIQDQRVATKLFDMAVNMGRARAVRYLQSVLNEAGTNLRIDGIYGPLTEAATNALSPRYLLAELCRISEEHYLALIERRPSLSKFRKGWLARAKAVPPEVINA